MPRLIEPIDAIARKLQRDVFFIRFFPKNGDFFDENNFPPIRQKILDWLDHEKIRWCDCADIESDYSWRSWQGEVFLLDALTNNDDPITARVNSFLEFPDSTSRFEGVLFIYLPLKQAMKNAHHDDPGYECDL
ncbi:MAG: hypothetical protein Q7T94_02855 [Rugosibacter sp.]|nr:hypothetical protein [Rugosibacter sp.]